jgi:hypothetical protein
MKVIEPWPKSFLRSKSFPRQKLSSVDGREVSSSANCLAREGGGPKSVCRNNLRKAKVEEEGNVGNHNRKGNPPNHLHEVHTAGQDQGLVQRVLVVEEGATVATLVQKTSMREWLWHTIYQKCSSCCLLAHKSFRSRIPVSGYWECGVLDL